MSNAIYGKTMKKLRKIENGKIEKQNQYNTSK